MTGAPEGVVLGIDVGGTKLAGVAVSETGKILARVRRETPTRAAADLVEAIVATVRNLDDEVGVGAALGIGLPGMLSLEGVLVFSPHLPEVSGLDLAARIAPLISGRPLAVANDADCALLAEHRFGAARGVDNAIMVTLGTGIGGSLLIDGRLRRGAGGFAGEIGHMVLDVDGPPCPCGSNGCWERFASGSGLARLAREAAIGGRLRAVTSKVGGDPEAVRGEDVMMAAAAGDPEALAVVDEVGWWLARGIANLVGIVDPELVIVGGGMSEAADLLVPSAHRHLGSLVEGSSVRRPVAVVRAALGPEAGAVGASVLGRIGT